MLTYVYCRCQDYVQIQRGSFGSTDICGTLPSNDSVLELEFGDFTVVFRTSEEVRRRGFEMYTLCFRGAERNMPGMPLLLFTQCYTYN